MTGEYSNTVASFWHGRPWTRLEKSAASSYLSSGYDYIVYSYNKIKDLPRGITNLDARFIWDIDQKTIKKHDIFDSYGPFADLFRYRLLERFDGITVVDVDQFCLKRFPSSDILFGRQSQSLVAMGVMRVPNTSKLMGYISRRAKKLVDRYHVSAWASTGPCLVTESLALSGSMHHVLPSVAFCPISPDIKLYPFSEQSGKWRVEDFAECPRTFGLQLWTTGVQYLANRSNFKIDFDKPISGSFYEKLCDYFS